MTAPDRGSVEGQYGFPRLPGAKFRVFVDGDMPRGVVAYDVIEGWAEVLQWDDEGHVLHNGEDFVKTRIHGKVEVREA